MIYFDHNATTPIDSRVVEAMLPYLTTFFGNPSSLYRVGRVVRSAIDTAREQVAALVDSQPAQVVFTSGGTEANNLALNTVVFESRIVVSAIEHPSIIEPAKKQRHQSNISTISVDQNGLIRFSAIETLFQKSGIPGIVSVMLANNETGAIQAIENFSYLQQMYKDKDSIVHTDAVQAIGKIPVSFRQMDVNLMSLSSHKIYGPKGCGALIVDKHAHLEPLLVGGGQEYDLRAGTENVAAIVGFGKAAELALSELEQRAAECLNLRKQLERELKQIDGLTIFAEGVERLPNTVQFGIRGIDGEMLLMQFDQKNIAVSSGSACASGGRKASSVLTAMGVDETLAKSAIRVSLGQQNTEQEINQFIKVLKSLI